MKPRFEIFTGKKGKHYFRLIAKNGKIVCQSEAYNSKQGAKRGIDSLVRVAPTAEIKVIE